MNIGIGTFLKNGLTKESIESALRRIVAAIMAGFQVEHREDGTHSAVTADSVTVGADPADGSWNGNVGGSLVPTADGQDLGATITQGDDVVGDHPWRNLRISGTISWVPFTTSSTPATTSNLPTLTRTTQNMVFASNGTFAWNLTDSSANTHTVTFGRGLSGITTNRSISCVSLSASDAVQGNKLTLIDGITAPSAAGTAQIYIDSADGDLKIIFPDGVVKTLATDT